MTHLSNTRRAPKRIAAQAHTHLWNDSQLSICYKPMRPCSPQPARSFPHSHSELKQRQLPTHIATAHPSAPCQPSSQIRNLVPKHVQHIPQASSLRTPTCGMMASCRLSASSPTVAVSTPSSRIVPAFTSMSRNSVSIRLDLPLPVRPTTPAEQPAGMVNVRSRSTGGRPGR